MYDYTDEEYEDAIESRKQELIAPGELFDATTGAALGEAITEASQEFIDKLAKLLQDPRESEAARKFLMDYVNAYWLHQAEPTAVKYAMREM